MILLAGAAATAQNSRLHTAPSVPSREALERLNLKLGWRAYVPMDGRRDGLISIQRDGDQLLVQTRSCLVAVLDAETGQSLWRTRVGKPYSIEQPLAFNKSAVFAVREQSVWGIDRSNGQPLWEYVLPYGAAAGPVADDRQLILTLGNGRVHYFNIEMAGRPGRLPPPADGKPQTLPEAAPRYTARGEAPKEAPPPPLWPAWSFRSSLPIETMPLYTPGSVFWAAQDGNVFALPTGLEPGERYRRQLADGEITVRPGQYHEEAYVAGRDGNVYAVQMQTGGIRWRYTAGTPALTSPVANDQEVYHVTEAGGLHCINRATGRAVWQARGVGRFVAASPKLVYAADRSGRLLILDRRRGTQLSTFEGTRDFVFPVANDVTDRIYLASNDGLIVCLHERDHDRPVRMKKEPRAPPQPKDKGKERGDGNDRMPQP